MNANGGEQEGDGGEDGERAYLYGARFRFGLDYLAEHADVADGLLRVGGRDDAAKGGEQRAGWCVGAQDEILRGVPDDAAIGDLLVGEVDLRFADALRAAPADVAHYADDGAVKEGELEVPAEGVVARPVALRERFTDYGGEGSLAGVCFAQIAAQAPDNA